MKTRVFARAIQAIRWINGTADCGFNLNNASSEALTVDLHSLGQQISIYELVDPTKTVMEKIVVKVFIDCLRSFEQGITLFLFTEDYILKNGYKLVESFEDNPFGLLHYNISDVNNNSDLFALANHIGEKINNEPTELLDYNPAEIFELLCKYSTECKQYNRFKSKKRDLKNLFSSFEDTKGFLELFN